MNRRTPKTRNDGPVSGTFPYSSFFRAPTAARCPPLGCAKSDLRESLALFDSCSIPPPPPALRTVDLITVSLVIGQRCISAKSHGGRTISRDIYTADRERHAAKMRMPENRARYGRRFHAGETPLRSPAGGQRPAECACHRQRGLSPSGCFKAGLHPRPRQSQAHVRRRGRCKRLYISLALTLRVAVDMIVTPSHR